MNANLPCISMGRKPASLRIINYVLRNGKVGISVSSFDQLPVKVEYDWVTISEP